MKVKITLDQLSKLASQNKNKTVLEFLNECMHVADGRGINTIKVNKKIVTVGDVLKLQDEKKAQRVVNYECAKAFTETTKAYLELLYPDRSVEVYRYFETIGGTASTIMVDDITVRLHPYSSTEKVVIGYDDHSWSTNSIANAKCVISDIIENYL